MKYLSKNQSGMVSLIVTMILMLVMSLIVIGFARVSRYEQRQALDRQLSAQAFYAAETGVNDAIVALNNNYQGYDSDAGTGNKTHCGLDSAGPLSTLAGKDTNIVNVETNSLYTCLLIDQNPTSLVYKPVDEGQAVSADLRFKYASGASATADHIEIEWQPADGSGVALSAPNPGGKFPPIAGPNQWNGNTAVLRMALTNFSIAGYLPYSREVINNSTFTSFLYPDTGGGIVNFTKDPLLQGEISHGNCSATSCKLRIDDVDSDHVYLRIGSIYNDSQLTITAFDTSNTTLLLIGGQAVIDSTGKSQDVLRRIQVRLPINTKGSAMNYAVQAIDGICKNFAIGVGFGQDDADPSCAITP